MDALYIFLLIALVLIVAAVLITRALVKSRQAAAYQSIIAKLEAEVTHLQEAVENAKKDKDAVMEAREKGLPEPDIPALPQDVIDRVSKLYTDMYERITGEKF